MTLVVRLIPLSVSPWPIMSMASSQARAVRSTIRAAHPSYLAAQPAAPRRIWICPACRIFYSITLRNRFSVGGRYNGSNNSSNTSATLTLAANNVITTSSFDVGAVGNGAANAVRSIGTVNLGANTTINADTIMLGRASKSTRHDHTPDRWDAVVLRGTDGSNPGRQLEHWYGQQQLARVDDRYRQSQWRLSGCRSRQSCYRASRY